MLEQLLYLQLQLLHLQLQPLLLVQNEVFYIYIYIYIYIGASERFQNRGGHDFVLDIFFCTPANCNISIIVA